jgi:hypothetical protein
MIDLLKSDNNKSALLVVLVTSSFITLILISTIIQPLKTSSINFGYEINTTTLYIMENGEKAIRHQIDYSTNPYNNSLDKNSLWLMNLDGTEEELLYTNHGDPPNSIVSSRDGNFIAYKIEHYNEYNIYTELWLLNVGNKEKKCIYYLNNSNGFTNNVMDLDFTSTGDRIVFSVFTVEARDPLGKDHSSSIYSIDINSYEIHRIYYQDNYTIFGLDVSPNDRWVTFISGSGDYYGGSDLYIMNLDGTEIRMINECPEIPLYTYEYEMPTFSQNGEKIIFVQEKQFATSARMYDIYMVDIDGKNKIKLFHGDYEEPIYDLKTTLNGKIIFTHESIINQMEYNESRLIFIILLKIISTISIVLGIVGLLILWNKKRKQKLSSQNYFNLTGGRA